MHRLAATNAVGDGDVAARVTHLRDGPIVAKVGIAQSATSSTSPI
ncbi:hypothetical protein [Granulicella sp. S190]|nr:hypothetical protein [Granulicella sp. S190]